MLDELRYVWRQLRRTPGFTAIAVLTLALGIAANTTFFGVIDAIIWRPLRGLDLADTYDVYVQRPGGTRRTGQRFELNYRLLTRAQLDYLKSLPEIGVLAFTGVSSHRVVAQTPTEAGRLMVEITSGDYVGVYRLRPLIGELSGLSDNGAQAGPRLVISERLWRSWFRSDPGAVGRDTVRIHRRTFTVAGVMPRSQAYRGTDIWMSAEAWRTVEPDVRDRFGSAQVRFRPGSEPVRLRALIDHAITSGPTPPPAEYKARLATAQPRVGGPSATSMTWVVLGLSSLVLLAACANLANMLYARAAQRSGEIAVRMSLGAAVTHVYRLFLLEAALIAAVAAVVASALAWLGLRYITEAVPGATLDRYTGMSIDISPDWRVFLFAAAAGALAALLVGGLTAWRGSRTPPLRVLGASGISESTGTGGRWLRTVLVAVQVSAAVILLLGTGVFLNRGFERPRVALLFDTSALATAQLEFDPEHFNPSQVSDALQKIRIAVEDLPGIEAGAIADGMFGGSYASAKQLMNLVAEDEFLPPGTVSRSRVLTGVQAAVSPKFLDVLGLKILSGRNLQPTDVDGAPEVTILSESAARRLWPGDDPLGKRVKLAGDKRWFTVVGTFEDPAGQGNTSDSCAGCVALSSYAQNAGREWLVVVRARAPGAAIQQVRPAVDAINPDVPVFNATVADRSIFNTTNSNTAFFGLIGTLGLVSLLIAALGVYGVISYSVSRRTREFGIRLAIGATPKQILKAVLDDAVHLVLVGLLPGVLLASWGTRMVESGIVNLMPNDIPTWAAVPILVLIIGVFAAWIPARRASRVNPIVALRHL